MGDDWLDQLSQLHNQDKAKHDVQVQAELKKKEAQEAKQNQAAELLRQSRAYELLRQVQKALLGGKGILDVFDSADDYERTISLVWQGPISDARKPNPENVEDYAYILVGVKKGKLWVNGKALSSTSVDALKAALLEASKKPGRQKK